MKGYKLTDTDDTVNIIEDNGELTTICKESKSWNDYENFLENGGVPEPMVTTEEKKIDLLSRLKEERNNRIIEADKWEWPSIQKLFDITQEQVEQYKQDLRDMPDNHTTLSKLENPEWPEKLITKELL